MAQTTTAQPADTDALASWTTAVYNDLVELYKLSSISTQRNTVLQGSLAASGSPSYVTGAGGALTAGVLATALTLSYTFAAGTKSNGTPQDFFATMVADNAALWTGLTANATNYLYMDRNSVTGAITPGFVANLPPVIQPATPGLYQGNGGAAWGGVAAYAFDNNAATKYLSNSGLNATNNLLIWDFGYSVTLSSVVGNNLYYNGGFGTVNFQTSPDGATWTNYGAGFTPNAATGANATQTAAATCRYFRINITGGGGGSFGVDDIIFNGAIATNLHWFNTNTGAMQYWNGAVWVVVQRVFFGEAVTNGTNVTSQLSYAIAGRFTGGRSTAVPSTFYTVNHNLGTERVIAQVRTIASDLVSMSDITIGTITRNTVTFTTPVNNTGYEVNVMRAA